MRATGQDARAWSQEYARSREEGAVHGYGLRRRTDMAIDLLSDIAGVGPYRLLDVGTADGKMLERLSREYPWGAFVGVEASGALARVARRTGLDVVAGDGRRLPFSDRSFDAVLLSATLKHLQQYRRVLEEIRRVLVPSGRLVILEPTPHGIRLGLLAGHFDRRYLHNVWSLHQTGHHLAECGFAVDRATRYMLGPVRLPGDLRVEPVLRGLGLDRFFMQQATLARVVDRT